MVTSERRPPRFRPVAGSRDPSPPANPCRNLARQDRRTRPSQGPAEPTSGSGRSDHGRAPPTKDGRQSGTRRHETLHPHPSFHPEGTLPLFGDALGPRIAPRRRIRSTFIRPDATTAVRQRRILPSNRRSRGPPKPPDQDRFTEPDQTAAFRCRRGSSRHQDSYCGLDELPPRLSASHRLHQEDGLRGSTGGDVTRVLLKSSEKSCWSNSSSSSESDPFPHSRPEFAHADVDEGLGEKRLEVPPKRRIDRWCRCRSPPSCSGASQAPRHVLGGSRNVTNRGFRFSRASSSAFSPAVSKRPAGRPFCRRSHRACTAGEKDPVRRRWRWKSRICCLSRMSVDIPVVMESLNVGVCTSWNR